uniref:Uncharacterized protein n=1 Tax=Anopheles merus TaxID=30066 RepID=A0A182UUA0_ANOME
MTHPKKIVNPDAKPRILVGYTSAFIEKGSVRKPSVAVKIKATSSTVGIQLSDVPFTGWMAHTASPNIHVAIPNPENRAGGRRPNLSEMNDISTVVTTRVSPTNTALRNGSIATPASIEKLAAYTIMTKMPVNCWKKKNVHMMASGLYTSGFFS